MEDVQRLGSQGDVVTVKDGYGRNYLIPTGKALPANAGNLEKLKATVRLKDMQVKKDTRQAEIMAEKIKPFNPELLITPEAKAIAFSYEVAKQLTHRRLIIARKSIKAYMADYLVEEVKSITTREKQLLVLVREDAELLAGRRVCILDDVVSTGGTLKALENLVKRAGASVVCRAAIWVEGPWYEGDLVYLDELPIFVDQRRLSELEKAV